LNATGRVTVVGAVPTADLLLRLLELAPLEPAPDVVLLDAQSQKTSECLGMLTSGSTAKVVVVAVSESEREVIDWAGLGVSGFIGQNASAEDIIVAIDGALRGEVPCPPGLVRQLFERLAELAGPTTDQRACARLTKRELEVVELLEQGWSNKQIANRLNIGVSTVKNHVHNVLEKLHAHRRGEALAILRGIVKGD